MDRVDDARTSRCRPRPSNHLDTTGPSGESKPADSPIEIYRHSSAHLLAAAVTELYPDAQCGIGPPTDDGFFYDFLVAKPFTPEDLAAIEKRMAHIVKQNRPIEKKLIPKAEALELFAKKGQTLKCELIQEKAGRHRPVLHDGRVHRLLPRARTFPRRGRSRPSSSARTRRSRTGRARKGNPAMQRIYGYAFFTKEELDQHLHRLEEAKRRDHRKLGRELDLFSIADETGRGPHPLAPEGRLHPQADRGLLARRAPAGRLRPRLQPPHREDRPLEHQRPHPVLQGQHVLAHRHRGRRVPVEADELPVPHHDLQVASSELPRAAVPLRRARDRLPLRALRRAARPHARARLHPGRRAPLLPPRPARATRSCGSSTS